MHSRRKRMIIQYIFIYFINIPHLYSIYILQCGLDIMPEEFDDVVPESIIRCFLSYVVGGVMQTMHDVGFGPNVNTVSLREISSAAPL